MIMELLKVIVLSSFFVSFPEKQFSLFLFVLYLSFTSLILVFCLFLLINQKTAHKHLQWFWQEVNQKRKSFLLSIKIFNLKALLFYWKIN